MTSEEKAEIAKAMRQVARDTFTAGFILGRQRLAEALDKREELDDKLEKESAEMMFAFYEHKLQRMYIGERN